MLGCNVLLSHLTLNHTNHRVTLSDCPSGVLLPCRCCGRCCWCTVLPATPSTALWTCCSWPTPRLLLWMSGTAASTCMAATRCTTQVRRLEQGMSVCPGFGFRCRMQPSKQEIAGAGIFSCFWGAVGCLEGGCWTWHGTKSQAKWVWLGVGCTAAHLPPPSSITTQLAVCIEHEPEVFSCLLGFHITFASLSTYSLVEQNIISLPRPPS